ncbi:hypothetical protein Lal_00031120 [Lupinus albus]|nr:hypothetical protein Lal_00031120 [Lupinus albus]
MVNIKLVATKLKILFCLRPCTSTRSLHPNHAVQDRERNPISRHTSRREKELSMSDTNVEDVKKQESLHDPDPKDDVGSDNNSEDDKKDLNEHKNDGNPMPSSHQEFEVELDVTEQFDYFIFLALILLIWEEVIKKKYGGLIPKKPPLISKDHERAYFDSADWALGKQGAQKPKGPLEALRPKLQPTQQHARSRRSAYAPADDSEVDGCNNHASSEDQSAAEDVANDTAQDQSSHQ